MNEEAVSLVHVVADCHHLLKIRASNRGITIHEVFEHGMPRVWGDERATRQIVLNLLSNSIRLTGPGGQVIVSTAYSDSREAVLRVRDTGAGMSEKDIQAALEPFRDTVAPDTSDNLGSGGTGFGLPLTKAIAEANRAHFSISSAPNAGTLVEIAFPPSRVVAE